MKKYLYTVILVISIMFIGGCGQQEDTASADTGSTSSTDYTADEGTVDEYPAEPESTYVPSVTSASEAMTTALQAGQLADEIYQDSTDLMNAIAMNSESEESLKASINALANKLDQCEELGCTLYTANMAVVSQQEVVNNMGNLMRTYVTDVRDMFLNLDNDTVSDRARKADNDYQALMDYAPKMEVLNGSNV